MRTATPAGQGLRDQRDACQRAADGGAADRGLPHSGQPAAQHRCACAAILLPSLPWAFVSRGWRHPTTHHHTANSPTHPPTHPSIHPPTGLWRTPTSLSDVDTQLPSPQAAALVKALMVRGAFGGMRCDTEMLWGYAGYWSSRLMGLSAAPPPVAWQPAGGAGGVGGAAAAVAGVGGQPATQAAVGRDQNTSTGATTSTSSSSVAWLGFVEGCYGSLGLRAPRVTLVEPLRRWVGPWGQSFLYWSISSVEGCCRVAVDFRGLSPKQSRLCTKSRAAPNTHTGTMKPSTPTTQTQRRHTAVCVGSPYLRSGCLLDAAGQRAHHTRSDHTKLLVSCCVFSWGGGVGCCGISSRLSRPPLTNLSASQTPPSTACSSPVLTRRPHFLAPTTMH